MNPMVHIIYSFKCSCGKVEMARFPWNPMTEPPPLHASIPEGWALAIDGSASQSPEVMCPGCRDREAGIPS